MAGKYIAFSKKEVGETSLWHPKRGFPHKFLHFCAQPEDQIRLFISSTVWANTAMAPRTASGFSMSTPA